VLTLATDLRSPSNCAEGEGKVVFKLVASFLVRSAYEFLEDKFSDALVTFGLKITHVLYLCVVEFT